MIGSADISPCGRYRYTLHRTWGASERPRGAVFVMLNPSTADAEKSDATVRKCIGFAQRWGLDGISIVNLFAFRSRHPGDLALQADPVGPLNDNAIRDVTGDPMALVVAAWGAHGEPYSARVREVCALVKAPMRCLKLTATGQPWHPLMAAYSWPLAPWPSPGPGAPR